MPSAKPDKSLIKAAVRERYGWERPEDIFSPIKDAVLLAISDGAITAARAAQLEHTLLAHPDYKFFPYSTLKAALFRALQPGGWEPVMERDLLVFLSAVFVEDDPGFVFPKLFKEDLPTIGPIYEQLFDVPPPDFSLAGKLCDFTGSFEGKSRKQCFEHVLAQGGTPSDGGWYTDCFFVADDHYQDRVFSNGLADAITCRAAFGITRIYREHHFK